ncbi:hypothetical protein BHE90_006889 [Fusarium euwallaceae]|uniref:Zn(2)-C6 fungal-type domain-containing protein n=2 Tax=Fusarium solani species complex TaxID=232080 RepID=A0A3M2SQ69_9HYPO|nr:hypothetical protein CDV36_000572 [Fusarium kuroshium]RTE78617.1 hypothetical protein BHE90_006889 [Fusarium euwallaceae]
MPPRSAAEAKGSGSGSGAATAKLRRAHRKSRNGCWECKRRHIKCDESRPACSNCVVSERSCSFPPSTAATAATPAAPQTPASAPTPSPVPSHSQPPLPTSQNATGFDSQAQSPADSMSSATGLHNPASGSSSTFFGSRLGFPTIIDDQPPPITTLPSFIESFAAKNFADTPSTPSISDGMPQPVFTAKHLILLHHATTAMPLTNDLVRPVVDIAVEWCKDAPYAVDQLLAIAADHLAIIQPEQAASHRRTARELQTRALTFFNNHAQELSQENGDFDKYCLPRFLFAALLSLHMIYETYAYYRANFHVFIERFVESVHLHRGVRTVISPSYNIILESPLKPFIVNIRLASESENGGSECVALLELVQNSDLSSATVNAISEAVHTLQWAFNVHRNLPQDGSVHASTAFPVLLTAEFMEAVRKHRPEALLVLAYYGVLLHRCPFGKSPCAGPLKSWKGTRGERRAPDVATFITARSFQVDRSRAARHVLGG